MIWTNIRMTPWTDLDIKDCCMVETFIIFIREFLGYYQYIITLSIVVIKLFMWWTSFAQKHFKECCIQLLHSTENFKFDYSLCLFFRQLLKIKSFFMSESIKGLWSHYVTSLYGKVHHLILLRIVLPYFWICFYTKISIFEKSLKVFYSDTHIMMYWC